MKITKDWAALLLATAAWVIYFALEFYWKAHPIGRFPSPTQRWVMLSVVADGALVAGGAIYLSWRFSRKERPTFVALLAAGAGIAYCLWLVPPLTEYLVVRLRR